MPLLIVGGIVLFLPSLLMLLAGDVQWSLTLFCLGALAFVFPPAAILPWSTLLIFYPDKT